MSSRFMNWPVASAPGSQYHHEASWNILKLMRSQLVKPQNPRFFWSPTRDQAQWLMLSLKLMQKKNMQSPIFWGMCMYIYIHTYNYIYIIHIQYTYIHTRLSGLSPDLMLMEKSRFGRWNPPGSNLNSCNLVNNRCWTWFSKFPTIQLFCLLNYMFWLKKHV